MDLLFVNTVLVCWLVYGNILFMADRNDCLQAQGIRPYYISFVVLICVGYFQMLFCLMLACMLPFIACFLQQILRGNSMGIGNIMPITTVLESITRVKFSSLSGQVN